MFSLIITVISIALVAALALATLYYGGAAFTKGSADAEASTVVLQGQQLLGAAELFYAEKNRWPQDMQELLDENYLKSIPAARLHGVSAAIAANQEWTMPTDSVPLFKLEQAVGAEACAAVNAKASLRKRGILEDAYPQLDAQCFGTGSYKVIFKKNPATLADAGLDPEEIGSGPIPGDDEPGWSMPPGSTPPPGGTPDEEEPTPVSVGALTLDRNAHNFGAVEEWGGAEVDLVWSNTGGTDIVINSAFDFDEEYGEWYTGSDDYTFGLWHDDASCGNVIPANSSCTIHANFWPSGGPGSSYSWPYQLQTSAGNVTITFSGRVIAAPPPPPGVVRFSANSHAFTAAEGTEDSFSFSMTNTGSSEVLVQLGFGDNYSWYADISDCDAKFQEIVDIYYVHRMPAGASCTIDVTFAPGTSWNGTTSPEFMLQAVTVDDGFSTTHSDRFDGTGTLGEPTPVEPGPVTFSPTSGTFAAAEGDVDVQMVTVTNSSSETIRVQFGFGDNYSWYPDLGDCDDKYRVLVGEYYMHDIPGGQSCDINVQFLPGNHPQLTDFWMVAQYTDSEGDYHDTDRYTATGTVLPDDPDTPSPALYSPSSGEDLGSSAPDAEYPPYAWLQLYNNGTAPGLVSSVSVSGAGFVITDDGCTGYTVEPDNGGDTCWVKVDFLAEQAAPGVNHGLVTFTGADGRQVTVPVQGTRTGEVVGGGTPNLYVNPAPTPLGQSMFTRQKMHVVQPDDFATPVTASAYVYNDGSAPGGIANITLDDSRFVVTSQNCTGFAVEPNDVDNCEIQIRFTPAWNTDAGVHSTTLRVHGSDGAVATATVQATHVRHVIFTSNGGIEGEGRPAPHETHVNAEQDAPFNQCSQHNANAGTYNQCIKTFIEQYGTCEYRPIVYLDGYLPTVVYASQLECYITQSRPAPYPNW